MRFSHDRRGQSVVIGTVILFGFLIVALSLYQVQVVPQQNAQTEFEHFEEVRNDLVELRAGILQAGSIDQPQYQTVRLGTSYSTRVFAINPPDPAGTIRTVESPPITISYASNDTVIETIPTRFIQYRPGYNELDQSPTWYDASVLYVNASGDGGGIAVIEDQALVDSNGNVTVVALQNEFRRSDTGRVTLELRPATASNVTLPEGELNVTIPTRLSGEEYWDGADIPNGTYGGVSDANSNGVHNLTLETTAANLTVDTVGVQEAPEDPRQNADGVVGGNSENPAEGQTPPEFSSISVSSSGDGNNKNKNNQLTFTYSTTDDTTGVTLFAQTDGGSELVNNNSAPTDSSSGETYPFSAVNMKSTNIDIEMTVRNVEGDSRICTGTITTKGGSLTKGEMQCNIN